MSCHLGKNDFDVLEQLPGLGRHVVGIADYLALSTNAHLPGDIHRVAEFYALRITYAFRPRPGLWV